MLRRIYGLLDTSIASQSALWCLFLVAFSFLHKSNLTAPSAQAFDPGRHLTREDIKFTSQGAVLRIRWSKTQQHRKGILLVPLPLIPGSELCPVTAVRHYFGLVPSPTLSRSWCLSSDLTLRTSHHTVSVAGVPRTHSRQVSLSTLSKSMVTGIQTLTNCIWPCLCPLAHRWQTQWPPNFINNLNFRFR